MEINIRKENPTDYPAVAELIKAAFTNAEYASGNEAELVRRLRKYEKFIPDLSLVAELDSCIVGYILLSPITVETVHQSLALAPVSVHPSYQRRGIGGALIREAHAQAQRLGHKSVILLGHPKYYPRFGYQKASTWGIKAPFEVPDDTFMAIELVPKGLVGVSGTVIYPSAFDDV